MTNNLRHMPSAKARILFARIRRIESQVSWTSHP